MQCNVFGLTKKTLSGNRAYPHKDIAVFGGLCFIVGVQVWFLPSRTLRYSEIRETVDYTTISNLMNHPMGVYAKDERHTKRRPQDVTGGHILLKAAAKQNTVVLFCALDGGMAP